jgi:hypothetical protein
LPLIVLVWVVRGWLQIVAAHTGGGEGFFNGLLEGHFLFPDGWPCLTIFSTLDGPSRIGGGGSKGGTHGQLAGAMAIDGR